MSARAQMAEQMDALFDGTLAGDDAIAFIAAQDIPSLTPEKLAGAVDAVMARAVAFPAFPHAIDCCGTGGDGLFTYNISTTAAFVLASHGVMVAKHGNRAISSISGSADVLQALGVNIDVSITHAEQLLRTTNLCFLFAPQFHPSFAKVLPYRKAIQKRTIFNILGPLCNPAHVQRQVIGVFDRSLLSLLAETAQVLGRECLITVHGAHGEDELSITGESFITALHEGYVAEGSFFPHDVGLNVADPSQLTGGDTAVNAQALKAVLEGKQSAYADAVALNAAAGFIVAGVAETITDGIAIARQQLHSGAALHTLNHFITESNYHV